MENKAAASRDKRLSSQRDVAQCLHTSAGEVSRVQKKGERKVGFSDWSIFHLLSKTKERQFENRGRRAEQAVKLCARLIRECLDSFGQESSTGAGWGRGDGGGCAKVLRECVCALTGGVGDACSEFIWALSVYYYFAFQAESSGAPLNRRKDC